MISLSYLNDTQCSLPSSRVISLPRHKGYEISTMTLTLIKLPPSQSGASSGKRMVPTDSQICSATSLFLNCSYMLKTCTQKATLVRSDACKAASLSYRVRTNKCLSKLHVSAAIIRSTSALLSKEKRTTWSSICFTLNPNFVLQRGVKSIGNGVDVKGTFSEESSCNSVF